MFSRVPSLREIRMNQSLHAFQSEGMVDVVNKRCQHTGCKKRPVFGFEGEKGRFCSLHRSGVRIDGVCMHM